MWNHRSGPLAVPPPGRYGTRSRCPTRQPVSPNGSTLSGKNTPWWHEAPPLATPRVLRYPMGGGDGKGIASGSPCRQTGASPGRGHQRRVHRYGPATVMMGTDKGTGPFLPWCQVPVTLDTEPLLCEGCRNIPIGGGIFLANPNMGRIPQTLKLSHPA